MKKIPDRVRSAKYEVLVLYLVLSKYSALLELLMVDLGLTRKSSLPTTPHEAGLERGSHLLVLRTWHSSSSYNTKRASNHASRMRITSVDVHLFLHQLSSLSCQISRWEWTFIRLNAQPRVVISTRYDSCSKPGSSVAPHLCRAAPATLAATTLATSPFFTVHPRQPQHLWSGEDHHLRFGATGLVEHHNPFTCFLVCPSAFWISGYPLFPLYSDTPALPSSPARH